MKEKCRLVVLFERRSNDKKLPIFYYSTFAIHLCYHIRFLTSSLAFILLLLVPRHQLFDGHVRFVFQTFLFLVRI